MEPLERALWWAALSAAFFGCHGRDVEPAPSRAEGPPPRVSVLKIRPTEEVATVRLVAVVEPRRRTALGSKLMARIVDVHVEEGTRVARGTLLVQLDARDLSARQRQIAANAAAANAQAQLASNELSRVARLTAQGALPGAQLDSAETSAKAASAAVDGTQAALGELGVQLDESSIRAPFDAIVVQKRTEVGSFSAPGQPLLVLEDDGALRVIAPVADRLAGTVRIGASYPVTFASGEQTTGLLESLVPSGDPRSTGLLATFAVSNEQHRFRTGIAAYVSVPATDRATPVIRIPSHAVVRRGGLTGAFTVSDNRLRLIWCAIDDSAHEDTVRVLDGLVSGDTVVVDATSPDLADGRSIAVQP